MRIWLKHGEAEKIMTVDGKNRSRARVFLGLGAIIMTVFGIVFESRLPRLFMGAYDTRITEGYIGVTITADESKMGRAEETLKNAGAEEVKRGWEQTDF